ncbi:cell wall hydrolase [Sutcliffiella horikoshii]|uniref:cell wall hydrolase n=1 Tax=Sutcliffiella horikoshii TaxID=79883 RepID=UPI001CFDDF11|nr:cell wall hydrolase [Sutcliffiella horikoshii]
MYKLFLLTFACFVGILIFSLASPASASAAGACLTDKSGLTEFQGLTSTDLLARLIYSEAEGESLTGKRGVAYVVKNRINKNLSVFGGNTYSGVILKQGEFQGMTTSRARCPQTSTQAWKDSLSIATNSGTNPVGKTLWFNTNSVYKARSFPFPGWLDGYTFDGGISYSEVVEKVIVGNHTFFRVYPY